MPSYALEYADGAFCVRFDTGQPVPIRHANLVARAVEVPAGAQEVVFRFVPGSFYAGAATSLAALLALVIGAGVVRVRVRRAAAPRARTSPSRR